MQCKDTDVDIQESITRLQNCILEISNWMMVNSLKINRDKTEFIIFGNKPATYKNYSLKISSSVIYQQLIASKFLGYHWIACST